VASGAVVVRPQPNAILFVVIMGSLLSVTLAMEDGRKQMPKIYGMAGRNLGARGFQTVLACAVARQPTLYRLGD